MSKKTSSKSLWFVHKPWARKAHFWRSFWVNMRSSQSVENFFCITLNPLPRLGWFGVVTYPQEKLGAQFRSACLTFCPFFVRQSTHVNLGPPAVAASVANWTGPRGSILTKFCRSFDPQLRQYISEVRDFTNYPLVDPRGPKSGLFVAPTYFSPVFLGVKLRQPTLPRDWPHFTLWMLPFS